ncbi:MAG: hypothetical protein HFI62_12840 [Lachnospiraceae bacterium]|nr:hypothetical protein [Lachnospiraceae bacterium]
MRNDRSNMEIEEIIRAFMKMTDVPEKELNFKLKAAVREQEALLRRESAMHKVSLWYLPMILNLIMFSLLALFALLMIENIYLSYFAAGICIYVGAAGILLTIVGVKRANIKEAITISIEKRGALA